MAVLHRYFIPGSFHLFAAVSSSSSVLGVEPGVSEDDLKRAYRRAAVKWHPDKNTGNIEQAEKKFKEIQQVGRWMPPGVNVSLILYPEGELETYIHAAFKTAAKFFSFSFYHDVPSLSWRHESPFEQMLNGRSISLFLACLPAPFTAATGVRHPQRP